jgi:hypothetical protein
VATLAGAYQIFTPSTGLSGGAIAGIVVGVLAACAIAGFFAWKYYKRADSTPALSAPLTEQHAYVNVDSAYVPPPPRA